MSTQFFGVDLAKHHFSLYAFINYKKSPLLPCTEDGSDLKFDAQRRRDVG
nr:MULTISPECIES: hypothetical protein [unclassified Salinivibrio]